MNDRTPIDLDEVKAALESGAPLHFQDLDIAVAEIHGRRFVFAQDRWGDPIQKAHRQGRFYEGAELAMIRAELPQGGTFVDIGANIGNHSIYVAAFLQPGRVIVFEPNPVAYRLLLANVAMNDLGRVIETRHVGLGLSSETSEGFGMGAPRKNLGSARMKPGEGDLKVIAGDAALKDAVPDVIKIDVEGMEMMVLAGLEETVARHRPTILIEVDQENYDAFDAWVARQGYDVADTHQRYRTNRNYLLRHPGRG